MKNRLKQQFWKIRRRTRSSRSGFTVIEMMVAITIVAVLATIAFPLLSKMKERAMNMECVSNQRSLGTAILAYAAETNGKMPRPAIEGTFVRWGRDPDFTPFLPLEYRAGQHWENSVCVCPSVKNSEGKGGPETLRFTYAVTGAMMGGTSSENLGNTRTEARTMASVYNSARVILLFESKLIINDNHSNYSARWNEVSGDVGKEPEDMARMDFETHGGHMNVTYCDGSVRAYKPVDFAKMTARRYQGLRDEGGGSGSGRGAR